MSVISTTCEFDGAVEFINDRRTRDGSPIHPQTVSEAFEKAVKRLGLPKLSLQGLRHTYATLALESGMRPWDLSDRLGHSSVAFTLQGYRHAVRATQDSAAEAAAAFILGASNA